MLEEKEVVRGKLTLGVDGEQWCDRQNFSFLYRKAIAERRRAAAPADKETFYRFLLSWHKIADAGQSVLQIAQRYSGHAFAVNVFEREILRSRIFAPDENYSALTKEMEGLVAGGDIIVYADRNKDSERLKIHFIPRRQGHQFYSKAAFAKKAEMLPQTDRILYDFLQENGASQIRDLSEGTGLTLSKVENSLMNLAKMSLVSCDNYRSFLLMLHPNHPQEDTKAGKSWSDKIRPSWVSKHPVRVGFRPSRHNMRERIRRHGGRWFLTSTFAALGKEVDEQKQAEQQAHLLLNRYGILVKEFYRRESGLVPWYHIFQVLKRMEWSGEIRRGYFIKGLSGVQFALPEAVEFLQKLHTGTDAVVQKAQFISTIDPALPFGGAMDWDIHRSNGGKMNIVRLPSNHLFFVNARPMVYSENFGNRLWTCEQFKAEHLADLIEALKIWLKLPEPLRPRKKLEIAFIDENPAAKSPFAPEFFRNGFETDGNKLVLWPSAL
ncbi:MAG: hypothetical protein GXO75_13695 [Calditrichaeota bacterium]|nr:hypothetical protein [Calditrichota bacterium]